MDSRLETLLIWLLRTSGEGAVLIVVVLGLAHLLGRHLGPRWRVFLWTVVGVKLLVPASLPFATGMGSWGRGTPSASVSAEISADTIAVPPFAVLAEPLELAEMPDSISADPRTGNDVSTGAVESDVPALRPGNALALAGILVWFAGVVIFLAILWVRQRRFRSTSEFQPCGDTTLLALVRGVARQMDLARNFRVVLGPPGTTPAVCGLVDRILVLPRDWENALGRDHLRPILLHELEHIRQGDIFWNWAAAVINSVHWFNPLVWVAASRFQSDRELRCDANALTRMQPAERIGYGRALLRVQEEFRPAPAIAGMAPCVRNHPTLQQRILMITKPAPRKRWLDAILAPGLAGLIALSFGSATAEEEKGRPPGNGERPREEKPREGDRPREDGKGPEKERPRVNEGAARPADRPREEGRRPEDGREGGDRRRGEGGPGPREGGPGVRPVHVFVVRDGVRLGERHVPMAALRGEFSKLETRGAVVSAEGEVPFSQVNEVVDALRDSGIREVRFGGDRPPRPEGGPRPEGAREGDGPRREGPRDGQGPRRGGPRDGEGPRKEGPRDGEGPRKEGPRDGEGPRKEGPRDGEGPRKEGPRDGGN